MKRLPKGHDFSPSAVSDLAKCPALYAGRRVARDERADEDDTTPSRAGTLVHDVLEEAARAFGRNPSIPRANAAWLQSLLERPLREGDGRLLDARRDLAALARAREVLAKAAPVDFTDVLLEEGKPVVEEPWTLAVGAVPGTGPVAGGVWDRVDRIPGRPNRPGEPGWPDGIRVVDYKTGGDVLSRDELASDPQALLYLAAARERWPGARVVRLELHYLARGVVVGLDWTPRLDEWARALGRAFVTTVDAYKAAGKFPEHPADRSVCGGCFLRGTCGSYRRALERGGLPDLDQAAGLDATARAFAQAKAVASLWADRATELGSLLRPKVDARGGDLVVGGHRVGVRTRKTPKFPQVGLTIRRLRELTGVPEEELRDRLLVVRPTALRELLEEKGLPKAERDAIEDAIERETGSLDTAVWLEVRALPEPLPEPVEPEAPGGEGPPTPEPKPAAPRKPRAKKQADPVATPTS